MKKFILIAILIVSVSFMANAQFTKGNILLGGQLSFSGYSNNNSSYDQNVHSGNFNISLGKALNENSVFGVNLNYSPYVATNYQGLLHYNQNKYLIGIFYRKYKSLGKEFYLFGEAGAGYSFSNETGKDNQGVKQLTGTGSGGQISFMPGIAYKLSKKFFLEISIPNIVYLQYSKNETTYPNGVQENSKSDQFTVSTSLNANSLAAIGVGFRLIL